MDISKHKQFLLSEIKINNPTNHGNRIVISQSDPTQDLEGYKNFIEDYGNIINYVKPLILEKYENGEGLGDDLVNFFLNNLEKLNEKYGLEFHAGPWKDWLIVYKDNFEIHPNSSGGILGGLNYNDEWLYDEDVANTFNLDDEEISDYFDEFKNWK